MAQGLRRQAAAFESRQPDTDDERDVLVYYMSTMACQGGMMSACVTCGLSAKVRRWLISQDIEPYMMTTNLGPRRTTQMPWVRWARAQSGLGLRLRCAATFWEPPSAEQEVAFLTHFMWSMALCGQLAAVLTSRMPLRDEMRAWLESEGVSVALGRDRQFIITWLLVAGR